MKKLDVSNLIQGVLVLGIILLLAFTAGCQKTLIVPDELIKDAQQCVVNVTATEKVKAEKRDVLVTAFTDQDKMLVAMAIKELGGVAKSLAEKDGSSPYASCDDKIIAWLEQNGAIKRSNNSLVAKVISGTVILGGIKLTGDAIEGAIGAIGTGQNYTFNDLNLNNTAGTGGAETAGGSAIMNTTIGGNQSVLGDGAIQNSGKLQAPGGDNADNDGNNSTLNSDGLL